MKKVIVLLLSLGFCGCATTAKYESKLNSWIGASENSLIASWGIPDKTYDMRDGKKAIEYRDKTIVNSGGYTYTTPQTIYQSGTIGDKSYSGTSTVYVTETVPAQKYKFSCKTSFVIDNSGKIESWHYEGNNCVSQ